GGQRFRVLGPRRGRVTDDQPPEPTLLAHALGDAARAQHHPPADVAGRQRGDYTPDPLGRRRRAVHGMAALRPELVHALGVDVEALYLELRLAQVEDKGLAHEAHADDADTLRHFC